MTPSTRRAHALSHPCCGFVPPFLLREIEARTRSRRLLASQNETLSLDARMRRDREAASASTTPAAPDASGDRAVYDAGHTEQLPGTLVRAAADPATGDAAVDEAHDYSGVALNLFAEVFGRRSVDGQGTALTVTVHYGNNYDNAFWDGSQLVFGDGDGEIFDRFTKPLDVTAHEFTHGVTQFTAGLTYAGQSGALNESVSDVFASMAKQRHLGQTADQADWLIGEGIFLPGVEAKALRSMTEPGTAYDDPRLGKDPQVGSMADYVDTTDDNGGVHINSGIPNRAFALAALAIGGNSWETPGAVWYDALTGGGVTADADFVAFADATVASASRVAADDPAVAGHVRTAWEQVGVLAAAGGAAAQTLVEPAPDPAGSAGPTGGHVPPIAGQQGDELVAVRRSGGFTGQIRFGELSLESDPFGSELRRLLDRISITETPTSEPQPDRFVYTVACRSFELTVPEQDLTPELHRVVQIVLEEGTLE